MKLKDKVRNTAYSSVIAALISIIIIIGGFFDMLDLVCASVASLIIHIVYTEVGAKRAIMIYAVSAILSLIVLPMRSCPVYYATFFGYFPVIRAYLTKKIKLKWLSYSLLLLLYNLVMVALYTVFAGIFGITEEPVYMYVALLISSNLFYICFDMLMGRIMILYEYRIKDKLKLGGKLK